VPCATGTFFIDRLPLAYDRVKLGSSDGGVAATATIDAAGNALVDLAL
jgi:hypothetical protein